jgi:uncharacterized protein YjeT (DUF2065 family)
MRDFRAAIGPVLAVEGWQMARCADSMWARSATAVGNDQMRLRGIGPGAAPLGVAIIWASRLLL